MNADPIKAAGEFYPGDVDATIEAIAQSIRDADDDLPEFTEKNVIVANPEDTPEKLDGALKTAAKAKGIALLVVGGEDAENSEPQADTPRPTLPIDLQLYLARRRTRRGKSERSPLMLCAALAKHLHHRAVRVQGVDCWDEVTFISWQSVPDDTYHRYDISFDREIQL